VKKRIISALLLLSAVPGICKAEKIVSATDMKIVGDGITMNTEAIQKAIDYCHSQKNGGCLVFTEGVYKTGTIVLKSNVTLKLEKGAVISGSTDPYDYYALEAPKGWDSSALGLILADHAENIRIIGEGTIDGNGRELAHKVDSLHHIGEKVDPAYDYGNKRPNERMRPKLLFISNCKDILVDGLNMRSSAAWGLSFDTCENLTLTSLNINNRAFWYNDGIDVRDSKHVRIAHCNINSADDSICLKSYKVGGCNDDVEIYDCDIVSSASAIKFGTASWGGFKNVTIRKIRVRDTYRSVVAIESVDGGHIENILVEDIIAVNTWNPIFIRLGHRGGETPGTVRNVTIRNMFVDVPFSRPDINYDMRGPAFDFFHNPIPSSITGIPGHCVENVTLENIEIFCPGKASKGMAYVPLSRLSSVPEKIDDYPEFTMFGELPSYGLYGRHVRGLTLNNVNFRLKDSDFRPKYIFDDVEGIREQ
jgi:polygalacturonase